MGLMKWNPFEGMDQSVKDYLSHSPFNKYYEAFTPPRIDVYRTDKDVFVKAEIPGAAKEDLHIYVGEDSVDISGQIERNEEISDEHVYRSERRYGKFSRRVMLPEKVEPHDAVGEYKDGILTVRISRSETERSKGRKIDIQ